MKKNRHTIFHKTLLLFAGIIFAPCVVIIVPLVIFNDWVFGRYRGWNYNFIIFKRVFDYTYFWSGIKMRTLFETPHDRKKKYVFVFNHIAYLDIMAALTTVRQPMRILAKTGPDKVPIFGYYYRKSTVLVDRSSTTSRGKSIDRLKHYLENGISIMIYPEGTFNMGNSPLKSFYDGAFRIAIETQTNIKPVILPDTFDRMNHNGLSLEPGKCRAVYLEEVSVQGLTVNDVEQLKTKVYNMMDDALRRYRASWIEDSKPAGEAAAV